MNRQSSIYSLKNASILLLSFLLLIVACSKGDSDDTDTPQAVLVSNLSYSPAVLELKAGVAGSSVKPTKSGTTPVTYSVTSNPASGAITIDGEGVIKASASLGIGEYKVTVNAVNSAGTATFTNAYTIKVTANTTAPSGLSYSPNTLSLTFGTAGSSATPTITSASAVTYTGTISPATGSIVVAGTGVIAASTTLPVGTYKVSITATNSVGSTTFTDAYTITVNAASSTTTFNNNVKAILQTNCSSCHNFGEYSAAKNNISNILNRISRAQGAAGMMPNNGTRLPQASIDLIQKWKDDGLLE